MSSSGDGGDPFGEKRGDGLIAVWAVPGARATEVVGIADGRLRVRLRAGAHDGLANAELVRTLADLVAVPRGDVEIVAGAGDRRKLVRVRGRSAAQLRATLQPSGRTDGETGLL
jgi:uncharacterized protein (TIGR00251 family)